ncbi:hypothetical protein [Plantactinospora sp. B5E13]|uniref:hypothetical protein n=1 Tax=unclassified Plantactinospora TaxID=2631981 RepID=UPI00325CEC93
MSFSVYPGWPYSPVRALSAFARAVPVVRNTTSTPTAAAARQVRRDIANPVGGLRWEGPNVPADDGDQGATGARVPAR